MKTCKICYKPLPETIDQYGPMDFIVCQDCFHLDGDRVIVSAQDDGYTQLPLFTFGVAYQLATPITQYVSRKQTQRQRAKRKQVCV